MKYIIFRGILLLIGLFFGGLATEIVLLMSDRPTFEPPRQNRFTGKIMFYTSTYEPYLLHTLQPHTAYLNIYSSNPRQYFDTNNAITIRANSQGFRGDHIFEESESSDVKIAFLGDSFTLGEGVKFEDTYPEKIAARLNSEPALEYPVKSYNYGMFAYNTTQEYLILLERVLPLQPDLVVVGYVLNDAASPYFAIDSQTQRIVEDAANPFWYGMGEHPPIGGIYHFRLAQFVWQLIRQQAVSQRTLGYYTNLYTSQNLHWESNKAHLHAIIRECETRRIPLIIACLPIFYRLNHDYPFTSIHNRIKEVVMSVAHGSTVYIDLLPFFQGSDATTFWVHSTDQHPNEHAHQIIADRLAPIILETLLRSEITN